MALAALVWLATLFLEAGPGESRLVEAARTLLSGGDRTASDDILAIEEPVDTDPLPLAGALPVKVDGWIIQGPQHVPGSGGSKVEAFFNPESEELKLVTPMIAYVQVTKAAGSAEAVSEPAARADARYAAGRGQTVIAGTTVEVGHTDDLRIYFIGWAEGDRVYTVEATYTHVVPAVEAEALLIIRDAAEEVASIILGEAGGVSVP